MLNKWAFKSCAIENFSCTTKHSAMWHTNNNTRMHSYHKQWSRHTSGDYPEVQYAFKYPLTHGILQFTMIITLRCVLHRCLNRDIRRWKLWFQIQNVSFFLKHDGLRKCFKASKFQHHPRVSILKWYFIGYSHISFHIGNFRLCKWSFRRFTYGNLVTTSPSSKW